MNEWINYNLIKFLFKLKWSKDFNFYDKIILSDLFIIFKINYFFVTVAGKDRSGL
jgi:hypothetical protein